MIALALNTPSKSKKQIIANKATHYFFGSLAALITSTLKPVSIPILEKTFFKTTNTYYKP